MIKFEQKGQALVEALLALSAAAVTVSVVAFLVISALNDTTFAKSQTAAAAYAKQGVEYARSLRDKDYSNFTTYTGTYCLNQANQLSGDCSSTSYLDASYKRQLTFTVSDNTKCSSGTLLTSAVSWADGECSSGDLCHDVTMYTCLATDNSLTP